MRNSLISTRVRYKYSEHPYLLTRKKKGRDQVHKPAEKWNDLTEANRDVFIKLALAFQNIVPGATFYAFGSRTSGIFIEKSDFDVIIVGATPQQQEEIKAMKPAYADVKFNISSPKWRNSIQIPVYPQLQKEKKREEA